MNPESDRMELNQDLLVGAVAISAYCGLTRWQVYKAIRRGDLPIFKLGALVCARRSTLLRWIEAKESKRSS